MTPIQQFYALVALRFIELEQAKLDRAELLLNAREAKEAGEITAEQYAAVCNEINMLKADKTK